MSKKQRISHAMTLNVQNDLLSNFFQAVKDGNLDSVAECIHKGIDVEARDGIFRSTALHYASWNGRLTIVQYLVENCRVHKEAKDNSGYTPLLCACRNGNLNIVKYLIETCRVDKNAKENAGWTALHCACDNGHFEIVEYLIKKCRIDKETKANDGSTALHCASLTGKVEYVQYLIEAYHVDKEAKDNDGRTALHCACDNGFKNIVKYLIKTCGVNTEAKTIDGRTALHSACENGYLAIVHCLTERCNVEAKDENGWTALHFASDYGHLAIAQYLVETCDIDTEAKDNDGCTALHCACEYQQENIVQYLVKTCHVDTEAKDDNGRTALHRACENGNLTIVQCLMETCDGEAKDINGCTSLHIACNDGHVDIVHFLKETGRVDMEASDSSGRTALHRASKNGHMEIVKYLIEACHVDKDAEDNDGCTALYYATLTGEFEIVQYLETCYVDGMATSTAATTWKNDDAPSQRHNDNTSSGSSACAQATTPANQSHSLNDIVAAIEAVRDGSTINKEATPISLAGTDPESHHPPPMDMTRWTINPTNAAPNIDVFPNEYMTSDDLPWYAIVIGSHDSKNSGLKESRTYRNIRNYSKYIPLEILYYKLILHFQQPNYINTYREIPSHEDQLLFVYAHGSVFRPIHRKDITAKGAQDCTSSRAIRDFHVSADIRKNGGRRELTKVEEMEHLGLLIQLKQRALDAMTPPSPYKQMIAQMMEWIKGFINDDTTVNDVEKHNDQIRDTWERYFPSSSPNKKRKK